MKNVPLPLLLALAVSACTSVKNPGLAAKVDKSFLSKYERLIKNRDGLAIVGVVNAACQGCFRVLPPQITNEIRMKQDLVFCEHCARILYIEE